MKYNERKMLKRGYIILIAGGVLAVAGLVASAIWAGSFAGQFLQENTIIGQTLVRPTQSINATLQVNDITHPISVALHFEPQSSTVTLRETVIDPSGRVVNTNEFLKDFFTTFKANAVGKFTLMLLNQGTSPVNVDGLFGYIPFGFVGQNNQIDLSPLNGIIIGIILFVVGIIALIVGIIFIIIDRRRESRQSPPLTR
jgi:hypothetical protein